MRYLSFLSLLLLVSPAFSQSIVHTVSWENGVNKKVVKEWSISLNKTSEISSSTYIFKKPGGKDKLHSVGHRDAILWIPNTTDLSKNFIMVIWFHGHWGYVPERTFENRTLKQFAPLTKSSNFVLVIPEMPWSVHGSTPTKRNSLLWMKPGDFLFFVNRVEKELFKHINRGLDNAEGTGKKLGKIDYRIVGHSAGGSTIKRLGITGDLCRLNPSLVVWSDSSYGNWLQKAWDGCLGESNILVKVFVQKWLSPWKRTTAFLGQFQDMPVNLKFYVKNKGWSHKLIGDNVVNLSDLLGEVE